MICPGKFNSNVWTKHWRPELSLLSAPAPASGRDRLVFVMKYSQSVSHAVCLTASPSVQSFGVFGVLVRLSQKVMKLLLYLVILLVKTTKQAAMHKDSSGVEKSICWNPPHMMRAWDNFVHKMQWFIGVPVSDTAASCDPKRSRQRKQMDELV